MENNDFFSFNLQKAIDISSVKRVGNPIGSAISCWKKCFLKNLKKSFFFNWDEILLVWWNNAVKNQCRQYYSKNDKQLQLVLLI